MTIIRKITFTVFGALVLLSATGCSSAKQEVKPEELAPAPAITEEAPVKDELTLGASSSGRSR